MQEKIEKVFIDYINDHNLTQLNYTEEISEISFVTFFNDITSDILGTPFFTHEKCSNTTSSLIYIAESAKEMFISDIDILTINSMYYGVITRLEYNYPQYNELLKDLFLLRKIMKKRAVEGNLPYDANLVQILIKTYLNLVYGMIDNARSILTSSHDTPREHIIESSKKAILSITAFLMNKGIPVYYIDTDEIHCGSISLEHYVALQEFYNLVTDEYVDTTIATISKDSDGFTNGYYKAKKQFVLGEKTRVVGLKEVNDVNVKFDNKKYFGRTFPHQFPEYAI